MYFSFSQNSSRLVISSQEALKVCKQAKISVSCNLPVQLRFILLIFLHVEYAAFDIVVGTVFAK